MPSLADLRSAPARPRDERALTVCMRPDLVGEVYALYAELEELAAATPAPADEDGNRTGPPRRSGQSSAPSAREVEVRARLAEVVEEMAEHEGEIRVRANLTDGEWRRWVDAHPARDEGQAGHKRDQRWTAGFCDADALVDDLGLFAHKWDGDELAPGDWAALFEPNIAGTDKGQMASLVVSMYEVVQDFPQLRRVLSGTLKRLADFDLPATSASPTGV